RDRQCPDFDECAHQSDAADVLFAVGDLVVAGPLASGQEPFAHVVLDRGHGHARSGAELSDSHGSFLPDHRRPPQRFNDTFTIDSETHDKEVPCTPHQPTPRPRHRGAAGASPSSSPPSSAPASPSTPCPPISSPASSPASRSAKTSPSTCPSWSSTPPPAGSRSCSDRSSSPAASAADTPESTASSAAPTSLSAS